MIPDIYKETKWTPPGWDPEEWQIIWRKLWILSIESIRQIAKKTSIKFTDSLVHENATKGELISILDEADKKELENRVDEELSTSGFDLNSFTGEDATDNLNNMLKEKGLM